MIRAGATNSDGTHLFDASFFQFDAEGALATRINARQAVADRRAWLLTGARSWPLAGVGNPQAAVEVHDTLALPSTLTREQIRDSFGKPETVPIYELPAFIAQLNQAGFAALNHRGVWLQIELSAPLMLAAMVLIGAGFTMRHTRFGKTGCDGAVGDPAGLRRVLHPLLRAGAGRDRATARGAGRLGTTGRRDSCWPSACCCTRRTDDGAAPRHIAAVALTALGVDAGRARGRAASPARPRR